jgi:Uma2 family endonuclease
MDTQIEIVSKYYTIEDYLAFADNVRREIIDGILIPFAAPLIKHARTIKQVYNRLCMYAFEGDNYELFFAPVAVVLSKESVVEPDIFICQKSQIINGRCQGAPIFILEVLSSNKKHDIETKFNLYLKHSVIEYWIADPANKTIWTHIFIDGEYHKKEYKEGQSINLQTFKNLTIDVDAIFKDIDS